MSTKKNSAQYRETFQAVLLTKSVTIPFLGVHLKDLFFIEEGNSDFVDGHVNTEKLQMIGKVLDLIQRCQDLVNANYSSFILDSDIQNQIKVFLSTHPADDSGDILYELSTTLEPVATAQSEI